MKEKSADVIVVVGAGSIGQGIMVNCHLIETTNLTSLNAMA